MKIINQIGKLVMKNRLRHLDFSVQNAEEVQQKVLQDLLIKARDTQYGKIYRFRDIQNYRAFREQVPLVSYEDLLPYFSRMLSGENNLLWPAKINFFAKSSGTTGSSSKFIPVSKEGLTGCHYQGGRDMLAFYLRNYPGSKIFSGKNLSIGGSQESDPTYQKNGIFTANISAIVMKNLPFWAQFKRTPGMKVTMMNDWEEKIRLIANITTRENVSSLAGSPMWMLLLLQHILKEEKHLYIQDIWPGLEVFFHGSVSFEPYRPLFESLDKGKNLRYLEIYNATEGFFALQDQVEDNSLLLMSNYGIFYEFIPEKDALSDNPKVIPLNEIEAGKNYSMVISTNSGLWRYKIGDTVKFTSTRPYRFKICGRTKHCINVFGEDLFAEHAEKALLEACKKTGAILQNFTVAPFFYALKNKGYHEWLVEFLKSPANTKEFSAILDLELGKLNTDYREKRKNDIAIERPLVLELPQGTFYEWLKRKNKLGGQHKIPQLSNSREFLEELKQISQSFIPQMQNQSS